MSSPILSGWERGMLAAQQGRERLLRFTSALDKEAVAYAVVGDHAASEWVRRVDEAAVRTAKDAIILLRPADMPAAIVVSEAAGFVHRQASGIDLFLDGVSGRQQDAIRIIPAKADTPFASESDSMGNFRVLSFEPLVRMMLSSNRRVDCMHLRDFIDVDLIDQTWPARFPPELAGRLQLLLDTPDG